MLNLSKFPDNCLSHSNIFSIFTQDQQTVDILISPKREKRQMRNGLLKKRYYPIRERKFVASRGNIGAHKKKKKSWSYCSRPKISEQFWQASHRIKVPAVGMLHSLIQAIHGMFLTCLIFHVLCGSNKCATLISWEFRDVYGSTGWSPKLTEIHSRISFGLGFFSSTPVIVS